MESTLLEQIRSGHLILAVCCILYLAWWAIFFWPKVTDGKAKGIMRLLGIVALIGAIITGTVGATLICDGANTLMEKTPQTPLMIFGGASILYAALLTVTWKMHNRQPTVELALFVAWLGMEVLVSCAFNVLGKGSEANILADLSIVGFGVSLVCYNFYYKLKPLSSFIDGCVPLALIGVISVVIFVL